MQEVGEYEGRKPRGVSCSRLKGNEHPQHRAAAGGEGPRVQRGVQTTATISGRRTAAGLQCFSRLSEGHNHTEHPSSQSQRHRAAVESCRIVFCFQLLEDSVRMGSLRTVLLFWIKGSFTHSVFHKTTPWSVHTDHEETQS